MNAAMNFEVENVLLLRGCRHLGSVSDSAAISVVAEGLSAPWKWTVRSVRLSAILEQRDM